MTIEEYSVSSQFDTGGPLMCRPPERSEKVLVGILDHASPSCKKFAMKSSLFMNIFHFLPWIHEILKKDHCGFIAATPRCQEAIPLCEIEEIEEEEIEVSTIMRAEDSDKANSHHEAHLAFKLLEIYAFLLLLQWLRQQFSTIVFIRGLIDIRIISVLYLWCWGWWFAFTDPVAALVL